MNYLLAIVLINTVLLIWLHLRFRILSGKEDAVMAELDDLKAAVSDEQSAIASLTDEVDQAVTKITTPGISAADVEAAAKSIAGFKRSNSRVSTENKRCAESATAARVKSAAKEKLRALSVAVPAMVSRETSMTMKKGIITRACEFLFGERRAICAYAYCNGTPSPLCPALLCQSCCKSYCYDYKDRPIRHEPHVPAPVIYEAGRYLN